MSSSNPVAIANGSVNAVPPFVPSREATNNPLLSKIWTGSGAPVKVLTSIWSKSSTAIPIGTSNGVPPSEPSKENRNSPVSL